MFKRALVIACALIIGASVIGNDFTTVVLAQGRSAARARRASIRPDPPAAEMTITLNEQFFNSLLDAIFKGLRAPSYPLSLTSAHPGSGPPSSASSFSSSPAECASIIILEREMSGVRTAVRFEDGRITAPLAFSGTYNIALLGCVGFRGWADTIINLEFDKTQQALSARVRVQDVQLNGIPTITNNVIIGLVQDSIDRRINPIKILRAEQLSVRVPIKASDGALRLQAKEVRPEIMPEALRLRVVYEFVPDK